MARWSRRSWRILRVLSPCLLLLAGCDGSGGGAPISSQVLAGKIGGQAWTFVQGETDAFLSDGNTFWVNLYASAFSACESFAAPIDENQILIQIPKTGGSYDLSLAQNATFYLPPGDNYVATRGHVQIDAITPTAITGGARITYDGDNTVEGQFQASICP